MGPLDSRRLGCCKWGRCKAGSFLLEQSTEHDICQALAVEQRQVNPQGGQLVAGLLEPPAALLDEHVVGVWKDSQDECVSKLQTR